MNTIMKKWSMPQLIVLNRGKPEEYVLAVCKLNAGGGGPQIGVHGCHIPVDQNGNCADCGTVSPT
jgi:hypothetical protein